MLKTICCKYEKGRIKPLNPLPREFNKNQIIAIIEEKPFSLSNKVGSKLCGIWQDNRTAEEIWDEIKMHRSGFGKRKVSL